jgi:hypothetical protein
LQALGQRRKFGDEAAEDAAQSSYSSGSGGGYIDRVQFFIHGQQTFQDA